LLVLSSLTKLLANQFISVIGIIDEMRGFASVICFRWEK